MKAAPFDYIRAESIDHAVELLSRHGADCKPIAGGQSLVPMMAMRLARPAVLLDINRLAELKRVTIGAGSVHMGAATRQRDVEDDKALHAALPLVRDALRWVGHIQTRNRGTVGGSLVHADPSAELPLAAAVLGATMHLRSEAEGARTVLAQDFFQGPMFTAVGETECLVGIDWPVWQGGDVRTAFEETAMRHGDFAMASAACQLQLGPDGICRRAAIGMGGVDGTPLAFPAQAERLVGQRIGAALARDVAHACAQRAEPGSDLFADAAYRRHLAVVLMTRVLLRAAVTPAPTSALATTH
jgi:carbon-monoxide dehydrogenase medium subunit/2-furoyl-CoA dehydrogenase FAD binding subunit